MDALLGQLRQQMHELSLQGDGFTLQMWKLYHLLEDFASHAYRNNQLKWSALQAELVPDAMDQVKKVKSNTTDSNFGEHFTQGSLSECTENCTAFQCNKKREYCGQPCDCNSICKIQNELIHRNSIENKMALFCNKNSLTEVDLNNKDYALYAGSTSADSGYKSCESTASEMSSVSYYDSKLQFDDIECNSFKNSVLKQTSPKIRMGTKAVIWQTKKPTISQTLPKFPPCKKTETRFYDTNLDHLMYLRASVMNMMKEKKKSVFPVVTENSIFPNIKPTSDFETESVTSTELTFESEGIMTNNETPLLEKEIDELLYGKAEYYDLESVENFPCSYVTMIEEKYKKGRRNKECPKNKIKRMSPVSAENILPPMSSSSTNFDKEKSVHIVKHDSKLSEVARCMLEIIQDLSQQRMPDAHVACTDVSTNEIKHKPVSISDPFTLPESEYHIYEEIPNDHTSKTMDNLVSQAPPPLPKRQPGMFHNAFGLSNSVENTLHKPKQRNNLYSLFNDRGTRRCLSASLAEEWKEHQHEQMFDDEYGFRRDKV